MHSRRLACLLLGMWLAGGLFMAWLGRQNLRSVDRLLDQNNPSAFLPFKPALLPAARTLLRYQAAEQNRFYFESWEVAQVLLGAFFFFFLLFGTREDKFSLFMVLFMLGVTLFQRFWMTPQASSIGRVADFLAANSLERVKLQVLQTGYSVLELVKLGVGLALGLRLVLCRRRSRSEQDIRKELDLIDKANYRHINR